MNIIFRNIIYSIINMKTDNKNIKENNNNITFNLIIKNYVNNSNKNIYFKDKDLELNQLIIIDELYSMSPYIENLFIKFKPIILALKKFKINSKKQLNNFLNFIINSSECRDYSQKTYLLN